MSLSAQIIITICVCLNSFILYKDVKKLFKFYKVRFQRKKEKKEEIEKQKQSLTTSLSKMNIVKPKKIKTAIFSKEEFDNILSEMKSENADIYIFIQSLVDIVPKENLQNIINKIKDTTIEYHSYKEATINDGIISTGTYNPKRKLIKIYYDKGKDVLNHELLHAASRNDKYAMNGFSAIFKQAGMFGEGLTEGYTELLNQRIFQSKGSAYLYLTLLAEEIENFYENKEDMLKHYFQADIFSLINELEKSMTTEEAIEIIADMDLFLNQANVSFLDFLKLRQKIISIYERRYTQSEKTLVKKNEGTNPKLTQFDKTVKKRYN